MPTHGFSSRLQQRYASTTAQGSQQHVRLGVYHRGLTNKLTSLGTPGSLVASTSLSLTSGRPPAAPLPVQTSSLKKENGGQDVTAVLVNRGGGKKVGWGSSVPTPAPASLPPGASLEPTPADVAAREAAEKEKTSKPPAPPRNPQPEQRHAPLPPPPPPPPPLPTLGNKNIPWALHPPSQPSVSLAVPTPPPHAGNTLPKDDVREGVLPPAPPRDDNHNRGKYDYPSSRERFGHDGGGGRYSDQRRSYLDGVYGERCDYDDRRFYRDREFYARRSENDYFRDRDRGHYRGDYRGGGANGSYRGGYDWRDREHDFHKGMRRDGSFQDRGRYDRGDDRRWGDYDRGNRHGAYRYGSRRFNSYDTAYYEGRRPEYDRHPKPTRIQARDERPPRPSFSQPDASSSDPTSAAPESVSIEDARQLPRGRVDRHENQRQRTPSPPMPSEASTSQSLHQLPPSCEMDAAPEAVRAREEAEVCVRRGTEVRLKGMDEFVRDGAGDAPDGLQRWSEDAVTGVFPFNVDPVTLHQSNANLQNGENQSSGEASGDASAFSEKLSPWKRAMKRTDATAPAGARTNGNVVEAPQLLEKLGELRQSALLNSAGQDSADVKPKSSIRQRQLVRESAKGNGEVSEQISVDSPVEVKSSHDSNGKPMSKERSCDTDSDSVKDMPTKEQDLAGFSECTTEEERRQKQQQIILQQVAAVRNQKEKLRRKEKKSIAHNTPIVTGRVKDIPCDQEHGQVCEDHIAGTTDSSSASAKVCRRRVPRTQGVLYRRLSDGTFVDADLSDEQIGIIQETLRLRKEQDHQQGQLQPLQRRKENKIATQISRDSQSKRTESPKQSSEEFKTSQPSKPPEHVVTAPRPVVSAWNQGPPPGIVKHSPLSHGLYMAKETPPEMQPSDNSNVKADDWAPSSDFPKLGQMVCVESKEEEVASWIPPPVETSEAMVGKRVIAAPLLVENNGPWNAFSSSPVMSVATDWNIGQNKVETNWNRTVPAPVLNGHADDDEDAHLTDGSGAVPRDLLSSALESEDDDESANGDKISDNLPSGGQSKRSSRSRRGGRGRAYQKNKAGEIQNPKVGVRSDHSQRKTSSRRGRRQARSGNGGEGGSGNPIRDPTTQRLGGGCSRRSPPKSFRQEKPQQSQAVKGDSKSSGANSGEKPAASYRLAEKKKRPRRPPKSSTA